MNSIDFKRILALQGVMVVSLGDVIPPLDEKGRLLFTEGLATGGKFHKLYRDMAGPANWFTDDCMIYSYRVSSLEEGRGHFCSLPLWGEFLIFESIIVEIVSKEIVRGCLSFNFQSFDGGPFGPLEISASVGVVDDISKYWQQPVPTIKRYA